MPVTEKNEISSAQGSNGEWYLNQLTSLQFATTIFIDQYEEGDILLLSNPRYER